MKDIMDVLKYDLLSEEEKKAFERIPQDILEGEEHHEVREFQEVDVVFEEDDGEEIEPPSFYT